MTNNEPLNPVKATMHLVHIMRRRLERELAERAVEVVPMHLRVLIIVDRRPTCTAVDIAKVLDRDKAQVTRLINGLVEKGLLAREPNPADKRSQLLVLTQAGQEATDIAREIDDAVLVQLQQSLTDAELKQFQQLANKVIVGLTADATDDYGC